MSKVNEYDRYEIIKALINLEFTYMEKIVNNSLYSFDECTNLIQRNSKIFQDIVSRVIQKYND